MPRGCSARAAGRLSEATIDEAQGTRMGRMLDTLRRANGKAAPAEAGQGPPPHSAAEPPAVPDAIEPDEVPFIEVGGPDRSFEASPAVLAAHKPSAPPSSSETHAPAQRMPLPRPVAAPATAHRGILFHPLPDAATPTEPAVRRVARDVIVLHEPDHPVCAQYRGLLGAMTGQAPLGGPRAAALAAVASGAGTTTVLLNLAVTRVRYGRGLVVVLDANLRRPAVAERLGLSPGPGLGDVLAGRCPLGRALRPTGIDNLLALTADGAPGPSLLPAAGSLKSLLRQLRNRSDLVLVDAPAWDGGPELAGLAGACDDVYLVVRPAEVGTPPVVAVTQLIPQVGGHLGGYIVSRT